MTVFQVSQGLQDVVARSRSRSAIPKASLSFEEKYRNRRINQTLNKFSKNQFDIDYEIEKLEDDIEIEFLSLQKMLKRLKSSKLDQILNFQQKIRRLFIDTRSENSLIYTLDVVLCVILFAKLQGRTDANEIAEFYNQNYLQLHALIDGMPDPEHSLSPASVNRVLRMVDQEQMSKFFTEFFGVIPRAVTKAMNTPEEAKNSERIVLPIKNTLAFDGQELISTFVKGEQSRRKKKIAVTLYNCTEKLALDYYLTNKKNNEGLAFIQMFSTTEIKDAVIMADALNSTPYIAKLITQKGCDYLLPIKKNIRKKLNAALSEIFSSSLAKDALTVSRQETGHSRKEKIEISILDGSLLSDEVRGLYANINTIVMYTKATSKIINGKEVSSTSNTRYYISSLQYGEESTLHQIARSIDEYWAIETYHHGHLDCGSLAQDDLQSCNDNLIANHVGINKIVHNIHSFIRNSANTDNSGRPPTFKSIAEKFRSRPLDYTLHRLIEFFGHSE